VLKRAAEAMGLSPPGGQLGSRFSAAHRNVAFYKPEDDHGFATRHIPRYLMSELTLVDDRGRQSSESAIIASSATRTCCAREKRGRSTETPSGRI
jgi:hypothetical protein